MFGRMGNKQMALLEPSQCIKGRPQAIPNAPAQDAKHFVKKTPMYGPWPEGMQQSENIYMKMNGIHSSQVGYAGGETQNASYEEVCTGQTNHNEVVRLIFDPKIITYKEILETFWERHDPTTYFQQGGDRGSQYRSGIYYYSDEQKKIAEETAKNYQKQIDDHFGADQRQISTEIVPAAEFFYAEDYHQQYDARPGSRSYT